MKFLSWKTTDEEERAKRRERAAVESMKVRAVAAQNGAPQKFAEGWRDGVKLAPGRYTAANMPAHMSGAGAIFISGGGLVISFR